MNSIPWWAELGEWETGVVLTDPSCHLLKTPLLSHFTGAQGPTETLPLDKGIPFKTIGLIGDIEDGGLKAPHLDSVIKTQRILCCKWLASDQPSSWKTKLLHYLKPAGGKFILCCNFDVKTLPIKLPTFYEECLKYFSECSVAKHDSVQNTTNVDLSITILWNNKAICVDGSLLLYSSRCDSHAPSTIRKILSTCSSLQTGKYCLAASLDSNIFYAHQFN